MPINADHEFIAAEKRYLAAEGLEEKIACLEDMIRKAPGHKGAENLRAELRTRLKKFKEKLEKGKKTGKGKKGIRKDGYQVALVGKTNSGKSQLLAALTNAHPVVSDVSFTTSEPELGTMHYQGVKAQIVDLPSVGSKDFDYSVVNSADCLLLVIEALDDLPEVKDVLKNARGRQLVVLNKVDLLSENEKRKLDQRCRSKRLKEYVLISATTKEGITSLQDLILSKMDVVRVYTKEPGKPASKDPIVLQEGSTVKDVAEQIYKGFSRQVKETRLTGPSGKFANQRVGMAHIVKDKDVVEFKT